MGRHALLLVVLNVLLTAIVAAVLFVQHQEFGILRERLDMVEDRQRVSLSYLEEIRKNATAAADASDLAARVSIGEAGAKK